MKSQKRLGLERELRSWEKALLEVCDLYIVGGTVRDILLGVNAASLDEDYLASGIAFDDLASRLECFGSMSLVGKSFGVIKFTPAAGRTVDISMPRTEFSTGPGHREFSVRFDPYLPVEKDLERRDYTINSMAFHLKRLELVDPLGGSVDLEKRLLRVNRHDSFQEDAIRILRGVQFMARFGLSVEGETCALMRRDRMLLETVSPERVRDELNKMMLLAQRPSHGFVFMHDEGILAVILPELDRTYGEEQNEYHPDDVFMHSLKSCDCARAELDTRWSALLHDLGKKDMKRCIDGRTVFYRHEEESARIADTILERLRFPQDFRRKVVGIIAHHMVNITEGWSDAAVRRFIARVERENIDRLLALREADGLSRGDTAVVEHNRAIKDRITHILESDAALKIRDLAITGRDVMHILGIREGPEVGAILKKLFDLVLEDPRKNSREELVSIVGKMGKRK